MEILKNSSTSLLSKIVIFKNAFGAAPKTPSVFIVIFFGLVSMTLLSGNAHAGVFVSADGRTDTYLLLHEELGRLAYEVPDCAHSEFGPHITQTFDNALGEYVFAIHLHTEFDNDRCMVFDRQRTEITTYESAAKENDVRTYQWQFKLDENFVPSTAWNHIFQIRPIDSIPGGNPVFTFSLLSGEVEELLFYNDAGNGMKILHRMPLAEFKGRWIDARVRAKFSPSGFIEVLLKTTLDNVVLLEWRQDAINLWPLDITAFTLPKWGNYRSLEGIGPLRNEIVLYNDLCIAEEGESCENLEMINQTYFDVRPAAYGFLSEISIDPFPTDQTFAANTILRFLRQALSTEDSVQPSARPLGGTPAIESTIENGVKRTEAREGPFTVCKPINWGRGKWTHAINPFVEASSCSLSRLRTLRD